MRCWCWWLGQEALRPPACLFVTLRIQLWMRELRRMVAKLAADPQQVALKASADLKSKPVVVSSSWCNTASAIPRPGFRASRVGATSSRTSLNRSTTRGLAVAPMWCAFIRASFNLRNHLWKGYRNCCAVAAATCRAMAKSVMPAAMKSWCPCFEPRGYATASAGTWPTTGMTARAPRVVRVTG